MKLIRLILSTALVALVGAGGLAQSEVAPVPVELPAPAQGDADRIYIHPHGDGALVTIHGLRFSSLWYVEGDAFEAVEIEDGGRVVGEWVNVDLEGDPAFVEFEPGGRLPKQYLKVEGSRAAPLKRSDGEKVDASRFRPRINRGEVWFDEWDGGPLKDARTWFFHEGEIAPAVDAEGEAITGLCLPMFDPDGGVRWVVFGDYERSFRREGATLTPVPDPPRPESLKDREFETDSIFTREGRVVIGKPGDDARAPVWIVRDGEPEIVTGPDDEPFEYAGLQHMHVGGRVYLFRRQGTPESTMVYRLEGTRAVEVDPSGANIGRLVTSRAPGCILAANLHEDGATAARIDERGIRTITDADGKAVTPAESKEDGRPGELQVETAGESLLMKVAHGDGEAWGILDGDTLRPISPGRRWNPSGEVRWVWEHAGRVYVRYAEVHDGQQYEWLGVIDGKGELAPLKSEDEEFKGAAIDVAQRGGELLVAIKPIEGQARLYRIAE